MVGSGTAADPIRPMFVPPPPTAVQQSATERPDLLGYQMQLSDNGKFALVEFVFQSPLAFQNFLVQATASPGLGVRSPALQAISADGSDLKALTSNVATLKGALEAAVPGLKLFERGKTTEAEVLTQFRALKANFTFSGSVRAQ